MTDAEMRAVAKLCEHLDHARAALQTIATFGEEDNEWDAVERYARVRAIAARELALEDARITDVADARAPSVNHPSGDDRVNSSSSKGSNS